MSQALEELEKIESVWQRVVDLLSQAAQDVQEAVTMVDKLFNSHKPHPTLESAIKGIEGNLAAATHTHNEVLAQIRAAKDDPDYVADPAE